jgi:hypothetical protein
MRYRDDVYLVFDDLKTVTPADVAASAARLGVTFPDGYVEYMAELGEGVLSDRIRIWSPRRVENELPEHRRFWSDNFCWDIDGPLTQARTAETVLLGDTIEGDGLVFHPDRPDDLFVLPRHEDQIYRIGPGLDAAIDWLCDSGVLSRPVAFSYFEPYGEREHIKRSIRLPYQAVRDALVDLDLHDHVAFEELPGDDDEDEDEDEEGVLEAMIKVGDDYREVDCGDASISLLIKDIGGDAMATSSMVEPDLTTVSISYIAGCDPTKLDRLVVLLDELEGRRRRRKPRKR